MYLNNDRDDNTAAAVFSPRDAAKPAASAPAAGWLVAAATLDPFDKVYPGDWL